MQNMEPQIVYSIPTDKGIAIASKTIMKRKCLAKCAGGVVDTGLKPVGAHPVIGMITYTA